MVTGQKRSPFPVPRDLQKLISCYDLCVQKIHSLGDHVPVEHKAYQVDGFGSLLCPRGKAFGKEHCFDAFVRNSWPNEDKEVQAGS